jgi:putative SOS response-associated peptidase YedK
VSLRTSDTPERGICVNKGGRLNPDRGEPEQLLPLLTPYPDADMKSYQVSTAVNKLTTDTEELIRPVNSA